MASGNAVWGIDIGQCALKAIKLRAAEGGKVEALAFDVVEHAKILSQPDADRDALIAEALEKFASRNEFQGDKFVIGVPGQQTFARFCKMPPIDLKKDAKKIHDLVRYEASQQIPFDIEDVVWDYQLFTTEGSPDVEVGIFAIRKDLIRKHLAYFVPVNIAPSGVQTIPAALYNYCVHDGPPAGPNTATILIDVGAQNTDLIIVEANAAWTRNIPLGGNTFTDALVRAFKLSFAKAEALKRTAATSKYARQIFQAMRPIFADLVAEIQRSIGFYSSTHRDVELKRVLALGNAFRLPGLQKYLENNLTISGGVVKLEKFNQLLPTPLTDAPVFKDNVLSFAAAYGLALQGLGLGKIRASLLPTELARVAVWQKKRPFFIATAASLLIAGSIPYVANGLDQQSLNSERAVQARANAAKIINEAKSLRDEFNKAQTDTGQREQDIQKLLNLQSHKTVLPQLLALVHNAMPPVNPPELATVNSAEELKKLIESDPVRFDRRNRGQLVIEALKVEWVGDVNAASVAATRVDTGTSGTGRPGAPPSVAEMPAGGPRGRGRQAPMAVAAPQEKADAKGGGPAAGAGFVVRVKGRLMQGRDKSQAASWLTEAYYARLRELGQRPGLGFYIPPEERDKPAIGEPSIVKYNPGTRTSPGVQAPAAGGADAKAGPLFPDPVTGEETADDWLVEFAFKVKLGEPPKPGEEPAPEAAGAQKGPARPGAQPAAPKRPGGR